MDCGEIKSMSDAQDVEKGREPQRPCYALDGVTQRQASHRERGGAEGWAWSWIRGPVEPSPPASPRPSCTMGMEEGAASLRACVPEPRGPLGEAQADNSPLYRW